MRFSFGRDTAADGGPLFQAVRKFFVDDDWNFDRLNVQEVLTLGFSGKNGSWRCAAVVHQEDQQVAFYSTLDTHVPHDRRSLAAEFLTRANYGLRVGNFEMDWTDGEVRFKTSIDVEGGELTQTMVKNLVYANCVLTDQYLTGLMKVIYGGATPEEAIAEVEQAA
jgi:hypothetical protein